MKRRILVALLATVMVFTLTACGNSPVDKPNISDKPEATAEPADTHKDIASENTDDNADYSNKIYYVGEDIPTGGYLIDCTSTDDSMEVIVFANGDDYKNFQNATKFSVGEYRTAVEQYAWADFYLKQGEKAYIGLREDYIILLDDGQCEFNKYNPGSAKTLYPGIYVVGEDISAEKINIKCTTEYMRVTLFSNKGKYQDYHRTSRFSVGDESDAITKYADSNDYINKDEITYVNLQDEMVMMVGNGTGQYSADSGPVIR